MRLDILTASPHHLQVDLWRTLAFQPFYLPRRTLSNVMYDAGIEYDGGWSFTFGGAHFSIAFYGEDRWVLRGGLLKAVESEEDYGRHTGGRVSYWHDSSEARQEVVKAIGVVTDLLLEEFTELSIEPYFSIDSSYFSNPSNNVLERRLKEARERSALGSSKEYHAVYLEGEDISLRVGAVTGRMGARIEFASEQGPVAVDVKDASFASNSPRLGIDPEAAFKVLTHPASRPKGSASGSVVQIESLRPTEEIESFARWLGAVCAKRPTILKIGQ